MLAIELCILAVAFPSLFFRYVVRFWPGVGGRGTEYSKWEVEAHWGINIWCCEGIWHQVSWHYWLPEGIVQEEAAIHQHLEMNHCCSQENWWVCTGRSAAKKVLSGSVSLKTLTWWLESQHIVDTSYTFIMWFLGQFVSSRTSVCSTFAHCIFEGSPAIRGSMEPMEPPLDLPLYFYGKINQGQVSRPLHHHAHQK